MHLQQSKPLDLCWTSEFACNSYRLEAPAYFFLSQMDILPNAWSGVLNIKVSTHTGVKAISMLSEFQVSEHITWMDSNYLVKNTSQQSPLCPTWLLATHLQSVKNATNARLLLACDAWV